MSQTPNNYPQTTANPVEEVAPEVIQCFVDWLNTEGPSDLKAYRILSALGQESLTKKAFSQEKRRFTAKDIAVATGVSQEKDATRWLNWTLTVENYWNPRERGVIDFAMNRGLKFYPTIRRNSTPGGPGNETTYEIVAEPIPENGVKSKTENFEKTKVDWEPIRYSRSDPSEVKLSWWGSMIFRNGEFHLNRWKFWLMFCWLFSVVTVAVLFVYLSFLSFITPKPITTQVISTLIMMILIPLLAWYEAIRPLSRLFDDRIKPMSDSMLAFKERDAQMEVYREGDIRVIRIVRYSSVCSICGADVYLDNGSPDFPRRIVGRCAESPREHVFSFDRVTRRGSVLRSPPL